ncbi:Pre-mRNA splicing factor PRP21-like protein [Elsinoe fawcettii]|nr:Pre-mRNA splicing factor PRP21-like protein [Elsinoe fawcettii]
MAPAAVEAVGESATIKPPEGVIIPPKDTRTFVEKTAAVIVRRGEAFERGILDKLDEQPKLSFLKADDYFNAYYQWRKKEIAEGRGYPDVDGAVMNTSSKPKRRGPEPPSDFTFSARMPTLSAVDLEVIKLTALFYAARGTGWFQKFSQIKGQNPQFGFLKPQHSCNGFFTRLVDQYRLLINSDSGEGLEKRNERIKELEHNVQDKYHILDRAKQRAEFVKYQETQKEKKEQEQEDEKIAYAQIDWHDFTLVGTIEFTESDDNVELPPPPSLNDLQSASLEQRATVGTGMRLEEAFPTDEIFFNATNPVAQPSPAPSSQPQVPQPPHMPYAPTPPQATPSPAPYIPQQAQQGDSSRIAEIQAESERAAAARAAATGSGPMRIKDNYIPRAQALRKGASTSLCPICKQQIPNESFEEHVRIEQLSPQWREQTRKAQERSATTNLSTVDVANNLKRLASQRGDVFDPITGREIGVETKRQEVAQGVAAPGQQVQGGEGVDVQEQIRRLQAKHGNPQG